MTGSNKKPHNLSLAPIRGITDYLFRNIFFKHFEGFDEALAPFINPQRFSSFKTKQLADVLPENNTVRITPQLLHTDPADFLALAQRLHDLGFREINWNLGCPAPMVTRKKRGSGLLPYPEQIISFLDKVIPQLKTALSVKTRLGFESRKEIETLLPLLNDFPLTKIIIHTRTGRQRYQGQTDPDAFRCCRELSRHILVYNGDINDTATFSALATQFPDIDQWMIGRGALSDPFIGERIRGQSINKDEQYKRLAAFHADLYTQNELKLSGPGHLLSRLKQVWFYLKTSFPDEKQLTKKLLRSKDDKQYREVISKIFNDFNPFSSSSYT